MSKLYGKVALCENIAAYHIAYPQEADKISGDIDKIQEFLENTDLPADIADAIDNARDALESKYFTAANETAEKIRNSEPFKKFLETWEPPIF